MKRQLQPATREDALERLRSLDREIHQLRRLLADDAESLPKRPFTALTVSLGDSEYAVLLDQVAEVLAMMAVRPLEESPPWVLGTFRYGDDVVVPLVDLRLRLQGEPTIQDPRQVAVLSESAGRLTAFAVDAVGRLQTFGDDDVADPRTDIPQAPYLLARLLADERELALLSMRRLASDLLPPEIDGQHDEGVECL